MLLGYCGLSSSTHAQVLTRGPYLQSLGSDQVIIRWRTEGATSSRVKFGRQLNALTTVIDSTTWKRDHRIVIKDLDPDTRYYYSVGNSDFEMAGGDAGHYFKTAPLTGSSKPFRAWVLGDFGRGGQEQRNVRNSFMDYRDSNEVDIWLWLGDNAYFHGTEENWDNHVFDPVKGYPEILCNLPFYPSPGNHDYHSVNKHDPPLEHDGPYFDVIDVPTNGELGGNPSGHELFYSFNYGNAHFISFNSELWQWYNKQVSPLLKWLEEDLATNQQKWTVFYCHHPPYSKGSHDSDDLWEEQMLWMRLYVVPILEHHGVDLVMAGHSHVYERSMLVKGHYDSLSTEFDSTTMILNGSSGNLRAGEPYIKDSLSNEGTIYIVSGNGGSFTVTSPLDHPMMYFSHGCATCVGSTILEFDGDQLHGKYLLDDGSIADEFTISKGRASLGGVLPNPIHGIGVGPNPVTSASTLFFTVKETVKIRIAIYDQLGKEIAVISHDEFFPGDHQIALGSVTEDMQPGSYVIQFSEENQVYGRRLLKLD